MPEQPDKYYLTTPIYYVNARPHIGHAYTTIVGDVLARRHRLLGEEVFFLTGTDEHGQKIERSAAAAKIPPQQFADEVSKTFSDLWRRMGITNDAFLRTTEPRHTQGAQQLFRKLYENGYITLDSYTGQYCVSDEAFVDVPVGAPCPDCGRITETITEENFFFKLSAFAQPLVERIESGELTITPEAAKNEVLRFIGGGLRDLSVSRSSFTWGIPVPEPAASESRQRHVIYVWLDALANYITALGYGSDDETLFKRFWPADLHLVGKEITRFHCVYWPAFLLAAGLPLPRQITANGWLLFDNAKMSKSRGNVVRTETILEAFGALCPPPASSSEPASSGEPPSSEQARTPDPHDRDLFAADVLRYYLLREVPFGQDGSFSFEAMVTRYNADLANGYGNLVSRVLKMIDQYFEGRVPMSSRSIGEGFPAAADLLADGMAFDAPSLTRTVASIAGYVSAVDSYLSIKAPWKLAKSEGAEARSELEAVLYGAAESIRILTALLYPFLPYATARVWAQLGLGDIERAARHGELKDLRWGGLTPGSPLGPLGPIFPRADKGLAQTMTDHEEQLAATSPKPAAAATPQPSPIAETLVPSTHPAAGPRTASLDSLAEPAGTLSVAGSTAHSTGPEKTPSHTEAHASGIFGGQPAAAVAGASDGAAAGASDGAADGLPQITIDDFAKVELRVAQVVVCERIPKADKLLRLEVDLGHERRQILSGIAEWYTPEELIGRRIVVITNLAPRKMRGLDSHGMLLAASNGEGGKPVLATFGEEIALGSRLK